MATHNADNERIKRQYFVFLKEAKRQSEDSVDAVAKALSRFEAATRYRDFKTFHFEQAVAFKKHLAQQTSLTTGGKALSRAPVIKVKAISARSRRSMSVLAGISARTCLTCSTVGAARSRLAVATRVSFSDRLKYSASEYCSCDL